MKDTIPVEPAADVTAGVRNGHGLPLAWLAVDDFVTEGASIGGAPLEHCDRQHVLAPRSPSRPSRQRRHLFPGATGRG